MYFPPLPQAVFHFRAIKNPHASWWKGTWPLIPWPQIKKKFLQICEWVCLLLQHIHLAKVNPEQISPPSNTPPFYVSHPAVKALLLLVQLCWCSAWDVMGQTCFLLVAVLCCEMYTFPLGKGLPHMKGLITQYNVNLKMKVGPPDEGKNQEEWIALDSAHLFQLRI